MAMNFIAETAQRIQRGIALMTPGQKALAQPIGQPNYGAFRSIFPTPPVSTALPVGSSPLFAINHAPK